MQSGVPPAISLRKKAHTKLKDAPAWLAREGSPEGARDSLVPPSLCGHRGTSDC